MTAFPTDSPVIIQVAVFAPLHGVFDYLPPEQADVVILPGMRVRVPFGRHERLGVVMAQATTSDFAPENLKPVNSVLDNTPLFAPVDLKLLAWVSRYYHYPLGEVAATALPVSLRQGKPAQWKPQTQWLLSPLGLQTDADLFKRSPKQQRLLQRLQAGDTLAMLDKDDKPAAAVKALKDKGLLIEQTAIDVAPVETQYFASLQPNPQQQQAIEQLINALGAFSVTLLEGITGSGKTEVYMQVIEQALKRGLQVLVLLPEIALTPQLQQRFQQRFPVKLARYHSKLSDNQRQQAWLSMQQGAASIMLGTRSALFTPLSKPGLIILDEEHDTSFKQQEGLRFSTRDVAVMRGKLLQIPVILGSATPSLESLYNVQQGRYLHLLLPQRAGGATPPTLHILDIRNQRLRDGLSPMLLTEMRQTLAQGQQVLLFLNRRGYAPVQMCHSCGWVARCSRCEANLVIHFAEQRLRCHHCGYEQRVLPRCPACKTGELRAIGLGTEKLEQTLAALFPDKTVLRLDRDSTQRKGTLEAGLQQISEGRADIIVGTQMLAKGHHFPAVTLVALLDVDGGLFSVDFHATERLAQLIVQVSGRAGRAEQAGRVMLQTRQPQHPLLLTLLSKGYRAFAKITLAERQAAQLPPFSYQALLRVDARDDRSPQAFLNGLLAWLATVNQHGVWILGPVPAPMQKRAGQFRYQLLLQSSERKALHHLLAQLVAQLPLFKETRQVYWSLDVDPVDLY